MDYTVKKVTEDTDRYELSVVKTVEDVKGVEVQVPQSIGQYSVSDLESQKVEYQKMIDEIDEKLLAISNLTATK